MLSIPAKVKGLFQIDNIKKDIRITFPNGELPNIYGDQIVQGTFSFTESICSQNDIQLGLCEASVVTFETVGIGNIKGFKITADCLIDVSSLGAEWCEANAETDDRVPFPFYAVPYGVFYVSKCPKKFGATKDHRTITAYTKQAYDDWETPQTIQSFLDIGWRRTVTLPVPIQGIVASLFPYFMEGEWQHATAPRRSTVQRRDTIFTRFRYRQKGAPEWTTYDIAGYNDYRYTFPRITDATIDMGSSDTYYHSLVRYKLTSSPSFLNKVETWKNAIREAMDALGYESDNLDEYFSQYTNVQIRNDVTGGMSRRTSMNYGNYHSYYINDKVPIDGTSPLFIEGTDIDTALYRARLSHLTTSGTTDIYSQNASYAYAIILRSGLILGDNLIPEMFLTGIPEADRDFYATDAVADYILDTTFKEGFLELKLDTENTFTLSDGATAKGYYAGEITFNTKDVVTAQSELKGLLGRFNRHGKYEQISINGRNDVYPALDIYPNLELFPNGATQLSTSLISYAEWEDENNKSFDRIEVEYKNNVGDTSYQFIDLVDHDAENYDPSNYRTYNLSNNFIIKARTFSDEAITEILQALKYNLEGMEYMPSEVDFRGLPFLEAGDYLQYDADGEPTKTLILRNTVGGDTYITQTVVSN